MQRIHVQEQRGITHGQHLVHVLVQLLRVGQFALGPEIDAWQRVVAQRVLVVTLCLPEGLESGLSLAFAGLEQAIEA